MPADSSQPLAQQATIPLVPVESNPPAPAASTAESNPPAPAVSTVDSIPPALAASTAYETIRELNQGGMGIVYLVRNRRMDRLECLKVIRESLLGQPGALPRFEREIRMAARLNHPNIVTAYSAPELPGLLAFAMEYVDGIDLGRLLDKQGPLPVGTACNYIHQAALGLQHAHEERLVHRDIKPGNLMLKQAGERQVVKILDFGLAKATIEQPLDDRLTGAGQSMGTPQFMAPEQFADAATADIRADIYSLGCTLYQLLSGHPPFHHCKNMRAIWAAHEMETSRPLHELRKDVSFELASIVARMLAKSPADRYQTPGEVAKVLAEFITDGSDQIVPGDLRIGPQAQADSESTKSKETPLARPRAATDQAPIAEAPGPLQDGKNAPDAALASTADLGTTARPPSPPTGPKPGRRAAATDNVKVTFNPLPHNEPSADDGNPGKRRLLGTGLAVFLTIAGAFALWKNRLDDKPPGGGAPASNIGKGVAQSAGPDSKSREQTGGSNVDVPEQQAPVAGSKEHTNSIGLKLTLIPAGDFLMGGSESPEATAEFAQRTGRKDAEARNFIDEHPQHPVSITKPFYLGTYEVTKGQFARFISAIGYETDAEKDGTGGWGYTGDDKFKQDPKFTWRDPGFSQSDEQPVVNVSWNDAVAFCEWLSSQEGKKYRLPTEAEWEYACRAGTATLYCHGDDPEGLVQVGNVSLPTEIQSQDAYVFTVPVGRFHANQFGLYDMHGNVREWCADWYDKDYYANSPRNDPTGPSVGSDRVRRGGGWRDDARINRAAYRGKYPPGVRSHDLGFRVALQPSSR